MVFCTTASEGPTLEKRLERSAVPLSVVPQSFFARRFQPFRLHAPFRVIQTFDSDAGGRIQRRNEAYIWRYEKQKKRKKKWAYAAYKLLFLAAARNGKKRFLVFPLSRFKLVLIDRHLLGARVLGWRTDGASPRMSCPCR